VVDDPTLRVARRNRDGELIDLRGRPLDPSTGPDRMVSEVPGTADELLLVHDPALKYDVGLFDAVCKAVAVAYNLNLQRLRVDGLVRDLESTRERLTAASEVERHRLERDLHDGAQQGFVAAQMWLGIARTELERGSADAGSAVDEAAAQLDHAIEQLRELAHGIYPSTLTQSGVATALRAAASSSTLPTAIRAGHVGRFSKEVEAAVYFACLEAMQNADKHAGPDAHVTVGLTRNADAVEFTVTDDGRGFDRADAADPRGVGSVRDRIRPLGGTATIRSARGEGTTVTGRVPLPTMQVA